MYYSEETGEVTFEIRLVGPTGYQQKPEIHSPDESWRRLRPASVKSNEVTNFNPLNAELNPICHLLTLWGAHHIFHVSGLRVKDKSDDPLTLSKNANTKVSNCPALGFPSLEVQTWRYKPAWMLPLRKDWTHTHTHTHTHTLKNGVTLRSYAPRKNTHYEPALSLSLSLSLSL